MTINDKKLKRIKDIVVTTAGLLITVVGGIKIAIKVPTCLEKINKENDWEKKSFWEKIKFIGSIL